MTLLLFASGASVSRASESGASELESKSGNEVIVTAAQEQVIKKEQHNDFTLYVSHL